MRISIGLNSVTLWASADDTYRWATRPRNVWPCSELSGRRFVAAFDAGGLVDLSIDGGRGEQNVDATEFNAITSDLLASKLPPDHPCYFVTVGQFQGGA